MNNNSKSPITFKTMQNGDTFAYYNGELYHGEAIAVIYDLTASGADFNHRAAVLYLGTDGKPAAPQYFKDTEEARGFVWYGWAGMLDGRLAAIENSRKEAADLGRGRG